MRISSILRTATLALSLTTAMAAMSAAFAADVSASQPYPQPTQQTTQQAQAKIPGALVGSPSHATAPQPMLDDKVDWKHGHSPSDQ